MYNFIRKIAKMGGVICIICNTNLSAQLRMDTAGNIGVGTLVNPPVKLQIKGNVVISDIETLNVNQSHAMIRGFSEFDKPSYSWYNDQETGMAHFGLGKLGFKINGGAQVQISEKTFRISPPGSQPMPGNSYRMYVTGDNKQDLALFNAFHDVNKGYGVHVLSNQRATKCFAAGIRKETVGDEGGTLIYEDRIEIYATGDVRTDGDYYSKGSIILTSDSILKNNIQPLNMAGKARLIDSYKFTWKSDSNNVEKYGFIAQQVQNIAPEMVEIVQVDSSTNVLSINLLGMVSLLYEDHKLLTQQMDSLKQNTQPLNQRIDSLVTVVNDLTILLATCCSQNQARIANPNNYNLGTIEEINPNLTSPKVEGQMNLTSKEEKGQINLLAKLYNNRPNPFSERTEIPYFVPEGKNASLWITDMNGKKLMSWTLKTGDGVQIMENHALSAGIYLYSLVVNGEVVDTKKMTIE